MDRRVKRMRRWKTGGQAGRGVGRWGWMDGERMDRWVNGGMNGCIDRRMDRQIDGWTHRWLERRVYTCMGRYVDEREMDGVWIHGLISG